MVGINQRYVYKCTRAIYYFTTDLAIDNYPSRGYKIAIRNRGCNFFLVARSSFYLAFFRSMSVKLTREHHVLTTLFVFFNNVLF